MSVLKMINNQQVESGNDGVMAGLYILTGAHNSLSIVVESTISKHSLLQAVRLL
jgi:hypothetical protein